MHPTLEKAAASLPSLAEVSAQARRASARAVETYQTVSAKAVATYESVSTQAPSFEKIISVLLVLLVLSTAAAVTVQQPTDVVRGDSVAILALFLAGMEMERFVGKQRRA
jgi:hypothetical protein